MCSYMTSDGSPYPRLMRAIQTGNLAIIEATAAELGWVALRDALAILLVIEAEGDERFERSAVRWAGRLALEVPDLELAELAARFSRCTPCRTSTRSARSWPWPRGRCAQPGSGRRRRRTAAVSGRDGGACHNRR